MDDAKPLKPGEPCPNCGGEMKAARVPTDEQRRKFEDRELRQPLPAGSDTMSAQDRAVHGALYKCTSCGYATRFPIEEKDDERDANGKPEAAAAGGRARK